jgi:hypothetical protein
MNGFLPQKRKNPHAIIALMDIHAGIVVLAIFAAIGAYSVLRAALRVRQTARKFSFYSLRRQHNAIAWRMFFLALFLAGLAAWLPTYGESIIYVYFPPSPTPSITPTITQTPTITSTPTISLTPSQTNTPLVTDTPTHTPTPSLPEAVQALFTGPVTPNPEAVFTAIQFSTEFDGINPINPKTVFEPPIDTMYGGFDYNNTLPGVQWTALWYRSGELVCYETEPWRPEWGTGGIGGYTECSNPIGGWQAGSYQVQIFMGYEWKVVGRFVVLESLTPVVTPSFAITDSPTGTP